MAKQAVVVVAVLLLGCESSNSPPPKSYGQVGIALVAAGSDGTTYRLPAGAQVELNSGQFDLLQQLDGNAAEIDAAVPPGPYTATLLDQNFATPVSWTLDRLDNAGNLIGTVTATLVTVMPVSLTVTASQITPLVFAFRIPTGGTINFDRGSVAITLSVSQGEAQSYAFDTSASLTVTNSAVTNGSLAPLVPAVGTAGLSVEVGGPIAGSWVEIGGEAGVDVNSFSVCAPPNIATKIASGNPAFADFIAEVGFGSDPISLFGPASLCVIDDGVNNIIRVRLSRVGAPGTPTYSVLGPGPFQFRLILQATLSTRAYDYAGHTLDLAKLMADSGAGLPLFPTSAAIFDVVNNNITGQEYRALFSAPAGAAFSFTGL